MSKNENVQFLNVQPNVNFLATLRHSGYNNYTAIADIIDNSLDTNVDSENVRITIKKSKDEYEFIKISDDGCGMDLEVLNEAFKLGAITGKNRELDLGSYGTGLKAAALSIGRAFEVRTKSIDGEFYIATYDLDVLLNQNSFEIPIRIGTEDEYLDFKEEIISEYGTIITIYKLDRVSNTNASIFKDILKNKLALYYKYFIDEMGVNIFVNGEKVVGFDPMHRHEPFSKRLTLNEPFVYLDNKFMFSVYYLEKLDSGTDTKKKIGRNNSNAGLYIYRNNRLIGEGLDLGIINKHGDGWLAGLRVELFMNGNCDELLGSTFIKMIHEKDKTELNQGFRDACKKVLSGYVTTVRNMEKDKSNKEITPEMKTETDDIYENINKNKFVKIKKVGKNKKNLDTEPKKETVNVGKNKFSPRERNDVFATWKVISLGENGQFFRPAKENGKYVVEINQDHPFWVEFLVDADNFTKGIIHRLLVSMIISLEEITYFDDAEKENMLNEYFLEVSENLRKLIQY